MTKKKTAPKKAVQKKVIKKPAAKVPAPKPAVKKITAPKVVAKPERVPIMKPAPPPPPVEKKEDPIDPDLREFMRDEEEMKIPRRQKGDLGEMEEEKIDEEFKIEEDVPEVHESSDDEDDF
ncbi:MAG: hypothetical protein ACHQD9_06865 [Chitinophagales bacterium]